MLGHLLVAGSKGSADKGVQVVRLSLDRVMDSTVLADRIRVRRAARRSARGSDVAHGAGDGWNGEERRKDGQLEGQLVVGVEVKGVGGVLAVLIGFTTLAMNLAGSGASARGEVVILVGRIYSKMTSIPESSSLELVSVMVPHRA